MTSTGPRQLYLDLGITHDYAEQRLRAIAAYQQAMRLAPKAMDQVRAHAIAHAHLGVGLRVATSTPRRRVTAM